MNQLEVTSPGARSNLTLPLARIQPPPGKVTFDVPMVGAATPGRLVICKTAERGTIVTATTESPDCEGSIPQNGTEKLLDSRLSLRAETGLSALLSFEEAA